MSNPTKTAIAKGTFAALVSEGYIDEDYRGLVKVGKQHYWISSNCRAYKLEELSLNHLDNIARKYHENSEEMPDIFIEARRIISERKSE